MSSRIFSFCLVIIFLLSCSTIYAAEYHVATNGSDSNPGTSTRPFKTIQKAASVMVAGDTCLIRGGTYRERIVPRAGGTSDSRGIVYKAYPGETPVIKGSERITSWIRDNGHIWKVVLEDSFFGSWNPYTINITGEYLGYGSQYHLGEVYLNGIAYLEMMDRNSLNMNEKSWYCEYSGGKTTIWANFGGGDPNTGLAEINVRESVIAPIAETDYLTFDGLTMQHAACNWSTVTAKQRGLVNIWAGRYWIIQNCRISDAKCAGICSTFVNGGSDQSYATGHAIIRWNVIERCGEAGIDGMYGLSVGLIEGNLIQDINYRKLYGGFETAGIKFHFTADLTIRNNVIRRVRNPGGDISLAPGIWVDTSNQGIRITGNVIYDIDDDRAVIMIEKNFGPNLVDNNVISGGPINEFDSEASVFVHNLFVNSPIDDYWHDDRTPSWWYPHSLTEAGTAMPTPFAGDRVYNNIFIGSGPRNGSDNDYKGDNNVYYQGAVMDTYGNAASIVEPDFNADLRFKDLPDGVKITFKADSAPKSVSCPLITREFIGIYARMNQGIENPDGSPITIDRDLSGAGRDTTHPTAGPFENLNEGENSFIVKVGPAKIHAPIAPPKNVRMRN